MYNEKFSIGQKKSGQLIIAKVLMTKSLFTVQWKLLFHFAVYTMVIAHVLISVNISNLVRYHGGIKPSIEMQTAK